MRYLTLLGVLLGVLALIFSFAGGVGGNVPLQLVAGGVILVGVGSLTGN